MKYRHRYEIKDTARFEGKEQPLMSAAWDDLAEKTAGKNVIDQRVFRKATSDSTIVTHQWETDE